MAIAINDAGMATGGFRFEAGDARGFLWSGDTVIELESLSPSEDAQSLNAHNVAVGRSVSATGPSHATIWYDRIPYDLQELTRLDPDQDLEIGEVILDDGTIMAKGHVGGRLVAYVLSPLAVPAEDLTGDCRVGVDDLTTLLLHWLQPFPEGDFDGDGFVEIDDLVAILLAWSPTD